MTNFKTLLESTLMLNESSDSVLTVNDLHSHIKHAIANNHHIEIQQDGKSVYSIHPIVGSKTKIHISQNNQTTMVHNNKPDYATQQALNNIKGYNRGQTDMYHRKITQDDANLPQNVTVKHSKEYEF